MSLSNLSVNNRAFANMIMIALLIMGGYAYITLPRELMSSINFNWIFISTSYPGAAPEEVEKLITKPIEDEIADVDKIDTITSRSSEGFSFISVRFEMIDDDEFDKRLQDIRTEVSKVTDLPSEAEDPVVINFNTNQFWPMVTVILNGDLPETELKDIADDLQDRLLEIKDVSEVKMAGIREREIWVNVNPDKLHDYHLTLNELIEAIKMKNLNLPGGKLKMGRSEYVVRTIGEFKKPNDISHIIVHKTSKGDFVKVGDLARISDTFEEAETISRMDGSPCISLVVNKKTSGNSVEIIENIKKEVKEFQKTLPPGVNIRLTNDTSIFIKEFLGKLQSNALIGLLLVLITLWLAIGWRNAMSVSLGIPVAFMSTFIFMKAAGSSLNGDSIFGLVLVLGMIVDDAIVISDNITRYFNRGIDSVSAVIRGVREVIGPVCSSSFTTMAAFIPLMFMPGLIGKFMKIIPTVVCLALLASLFEAIFILPAHMADWGRPRKTRKSVWFGQFRKGYLRLLKKALKFRYLIMVLLLVIAVLCGTLIALGIVPVDMFSGDEMPMFFIQLTMPAGTKLEVTDQALSQIEKAALSIPQEERKAIITLAGRLDLEKESINSPDVGQVTVELVPENQRKRSVDEVIKDLRGKLKLFTGYKNLVFKKVENGPPAGKPVEVKVKGKYFDELKIVVEKLKAELGKMPGVFDIEDNFPLGGKEIRILVDEEKAALFGMDVTAIASTIRTAFKGTVATIFRDGDEEVDVVVKLEEKHRQKITDLENLKVTTAKGALIPMKELARVVIEPGYSIIRHFEKERAITVSANIDKTINQAPAVNRKLKEIFSNIGQLYPGYSLDFRGEFKEFEDAFSSLTQLFAIGVIIIYLILGAQFKSFSQPFLILFSVPFSFFGAVLGLLVTRSTFSINTMYGIVGLAGIVVNDSLVLVDFINNARNNGRRKWSSLIRSGALRLQPILLTSITTIFGLLPMALGIGGKSLIWGPMANVIIWGLLVATVLTLFAIPALYAILDDITNLKSRKT